jgi:DNA-binding response OmpR family regulator
MKILIIEDELLIQQSLKKLLIRKGADVDTSSSGKKAIELILSNDYDRIICDLMLQDITGFDIIEESKKKYNSIEIERKFVIMTAYSSGQVLAKAGEYNCIVLNKPFDNLDAALNTMLNIKSDYKKEAKKSIDHTQAR